MQRTDSFTSAKILTRTAQVFSAVFNPNLCQFIVFLYIIKKISPFMLYGGLFFLFILPFIAYILYMRLFLKRKNLYVLERNKRFIPFTLNIISIYAFYGLSEVYQPEATAFYFTFFINAVSFFITLFWRISLHMVAAVTACSYIIYSYSLREFAFFRLVNLETIAEWLLVSIIVLILSTPFVGWSRVYLRAHTLLQVLGGAFMGLLLPIIYNFFYTALK